MLNYAHRGGSDYAPENTISSFYLGLLLGANAVETDVRRCASGEVILFHDTKLDRVTDGEGIVPKTNLEDLKKLKVYGNSGSTFYDRIPTYREFLENFAKYDIHFAIELKGPGVEEDVLALSREFGIVERTTFTSGAFDRLAKMKELDPTLRVGWLKPDPTDEDLEQFLAIGGDEICPRARFTTEEKVKKYRSLGLGVRVWYVENSPMMAEMVRIGVDGMTINYPDRLITHLSTHSEEE